MKKEVGRLAEPLDCKLLWSEADRKGGWVEGRCCAPLFKEALQSIMELRRQG